jgi:hypothetical protein
MPMIHDPPLRIDLDLDDPKVWQLLSGYPVRACSTTGQPVEVTLKIDWTQVMRAVFVTAHRFGELPPPDPPQAREFLPWRSK